MITIERNLPSLYETNYSFEENKCEFLSNIYEKMEKDEREEEFLKFNDENIKKIINVFNNETEKRKINEELIIKSNLLNKVNPVDLHLIDITSCRKNISNIKILHQIEIIEEKILNVFNESKRSFFYFLKEKVKNENISQYSLFSEEINDIKCEKIELFNNEKLSMVFRGSYLLNKGNNYQHLDKYKNEKCFYNVNSYNDGSMRVLITKSYLI